MNTDKSNIKKADRSIVFLGYFFAILGGVFGILIGANYAFNNYDQEIRKKGVQMILISIIMFFVWVLIAYMIVR